MNLIFVCGLFPKDRFNEIIANSKGIIHFAPNLLQWSFVDGLMSNFDKVLVLTSPLVPSYPRSYAKLKIKDSKFSLREGDTHYCIGSLRLPLIGLFSKTSNIFATLLKSRKEHGYILIYSVHLPYLLASWLYKTLFNKNKICLFVNDMPQYMSSNNNNIYRFFKSIELLIFNFLLKKVDSFIFVTDFFPSKLRIGDRPWMVLEGTYTIKNDYKPFITSLINPSKIIMYSGTLDSRYGILDLLDAFKLIKEQYSDYELWICGDGDMKGHIANMAENDTQITYFGQINHDHVLELQAKANVLVNPRRPEGEYTKYSFPIKTIEYLASGRPCVMHGLAGLPAEYIEHLFIPKQVNAESLAEMIVYVCNMDAGIMDDHCRKAYDFVKYKKTPHYQFNRVKSFLLES